MCVFAGRPICFSSSVVANVLLARCSPAFRLQKLCGNGSDKRKTTIGGIGTILSACGSVFACESGTCPVHKMPYLDPLCHQTELGLFNFHY